MNRKENFRVATVHPLYNYYGCNSKQCDNEETMKKLNFLFTFNTSSTTVIEISPQRMWSICLGGDEDVTGLVKTFLSNNPIYSRQRLLWHVPRACRTAHGCCNFWSDPAGLWGSGWCWSIQSCRLRCIPSSIYCTHTHRTQGILVYCLHVHQMLMMCEMINCGQTRIFSDMYCC